MWKHNCFVPDYLKYALYVKCMSDSKWSCNTSCTNIIKQASKVRVKSGQFLSLCNHCCVNERHAWCCECVMIQHRTRLYLQLPTETQYYCYHGKCRVCITFTHARYPGNHTNTVTTASDFNSIHELLRTCEALHLTWILLISESKYTFVTQ